MSFNISLNRKFTVNGKDYDSIEEMPEDIRDLYAKAMGSVKDAGHQGNNTVSIQTKIIFNGAEYESIDAMPRDVRQSYEALMRVAKNGTTSSSLFSMALSGGPEKNSGLPGAAGPEIKYQFSLSGRRLILNILFAVLVFLVYYIWKSK